MTTLSFFLKTIISNFFKETVTWLWKKIGRKISPKCHSFSALEESESGFQADYRKQFYFLFNGTEIISHLNRDPIKVVRNLSWKLLAYSPPINMLNVAIFCQASIQQNGKKPSHAAVPLNVTYFSPFLKMSSCGGGEGEGDGADRVFLYQKGQIQPSIVQKPNS